MEKFTDKTQQKTKDFFFSKSEKDKTPFLFNTELEGVARVLRQERKIKGLDIEKKK